MDVEGPGAHLLAMLFTLNEEETLGRKQMIPPDSTLGIECVPSPTISRKALPSAGFWNSSECVRT
jgi:hypothetical protein